jgi:Asp-tRNA(Asn)/Glu-tRNA(Gln) amidotransferase A subunit family amidase/Tfp pilus assembly protein PilF
MQAQEESFALKDAASDETEAPATSRDATFDASTSGTPASVAESATEESLQEHNPITETVLEMSKSPDEDAKAPRSSPRRPRFPQPATMALAAAAVGAALTLAHRLFRRKNKLEDSAYLHPLELRHPSVPMDPTATFSSSLSTSSRPLDGRTFVVSDRLNVQGLVTRFGCDQWADTLQPSTVSAVIVDQLISLGAVGIGVANTSPLGCGPPLFDTPKNRVANPRAQVGRTHGGGEYGPAVAVASGKADLAVAVDEVGSAVIAAACCGIYAYRPTSGVLPLGGATILSPILATTCMMADDASVLVRTAKSLPGAPKDPAATVVANYLVAEDLFALCGGEMNDASPVVVSAVKRWAGADQAKAITLCDFLRQRFPSLRPFMPGGEFFTPYDPLNGVSDASSSAANGSDAAISAGKVAAEEVLNALHRAVYLIHACESRKSVPGSWAIETIKEAFAQGTSGGLPFEIWERFGSSAQGWSIRGEAYQAAVAMADEISRGMRAALVEGYVFVLPTTPGPPPCAEDRRAVEMHLRCTQKFAALSCLGGLPQVAIPLSLPGVSPLSVSLVGLQRKDAMLLQAGAKLGELLADEVAKLGSSKSKPGGAGSDTSKSKTPRAKAEEAATAAVALAAAARTSGEAAKKCGNDAFRSGKYDEAVRWYSEAIKHNPEEAVYYSNRAMAHLKLGAYTAAETDCDAAIERDAYSVKAWLRRGSARLALGLLEEAEEDLQRVLELEPQNKQASEELARLQRVASGGTSSSWHG